MTDRRSFFRDREVIGDLCLKKDRKVIEITKFNDRDHVISTLNKTEHNSVQNRW